MDKDITTTAVNFNKPVTLFAVKPLALSCLANLGHGYSNT